MVLVLAKIMGQFKIIESIGQKLVSHLTVINFYNKFIWKKQEWELLERWVDMDQLSC